MSDLNAPLEMVTRPPGVTNLAASGATSGATSGVFLYEFALATRVPNFPCCTGLACHTAEVPYVFNQMHIIEQSFSWWGQGHSPSRSQGPTHDTTVQRDPSLTSSREVRALLFWKVQQYTKYT